MRHVPICFLEGWRLEIQVDPAGSTLQLYSSAPPSAGILAAQDVAGASGKAARKLGPMGPSGAGPQRWWGTGGIYMALEGKFGRNQWFQCSTLIFGGFLSFFPSTNSGRYSPTSHGGSSSHFTQKNVETSTNAKVPEPGVIVKTEWETSSETTTCNSVYHWTAANKHFPTAVCLQWSNLLNNYIMSQNPTGKHANCSLRWADYCSLLGCSPDQKHHKVMHQHTIHTCRREYIDPRHRFHHLEDPDEALRTTCSQGALPKFKTQSFTTPCMAGSCRLCLSLSLPPPRQKWIRKCHIPIWATSKTNTNLRKLWDSQKLGQNGPSKFDTNLWSGELYLHIAPDLIPRLQSILSITRFLILSRGGPNGAEPGMLDDIIQAQSMFRLMFQQAQKQLLSLRRLRPSAPKTLQIIVAKEVWVIFFAWKRLMVLFIHDSWYKFCFIYAHMCIYIYMYIYMCVCAYIHMYYVHMYIYIYVCICIHVYHICG